MEVHIAELITKIGSLGDQGDETIFDDQVDIGTLHDCIPYGTAGRDSELLATVEVVRNQLGTIKNHKKVLWSGQTYAFGGLGDRVTESILRE